jgi:hypothetical protein
LEKAPSLAPPGGRNPLSVALTFDEAERGKRLYMSGRWEIERGRKRPLWGYCYYDYTVI